MDAFALLRLLALLALFAPTFQQPGVGAGAGAGAGAADNQCIQLSASARLLTDFDWKYNCHLIFPRIRNMGAEAVNIIITGYWIDLNGDNVVDKFCRKLGNHPCVDNTPEITETFIKNVAQCLQTADKLGFKKIEITPHLDDANQTARWRNRLLLDPTKEYQGLSYQQLMIDPLIEAVNTANLKAQIYMSLQGEMNGALFVYPKKWTALGEDMRKKLPAGSKLGLNNNYNTLCVADCDNVDQEAVAELYDSMDYVGISAYRYVSVGFAPDMLGGSAMEFNEGLVPLGADLNEFLAKPGKELHYSEFGVGGGALCGAQGSLDACLANGPNDVAMYPYFGVGANYLPKFDPWASDANREFMHYFYEQAVAFAQNGGGGGWKVNQIYIWGYGSYDVVGVHPMSTTGYGTYEDPEVIDIVTKHNAQCPLA